MRGESANVPNKPSDYKIRISICSQSVPEYCTYIEEFAPKLGDALGAAARQKVVEPW
jgi:hypothetical protein